MSWNEPGKNGNQDKLLSDFLHKVRDLLLASKDASGNWHPLPPKRFGFKLGFVFIALFSLWLLSGLFIVNPAEEAVILRFGKRMTIDQPGLHWYARFIDTKYSVFEKNKKV